MTANVSTAHAANMVTHPCFNPRAASKFGRLHLPVAPECNIRCNYCNRRHDCPHESRPGVSSTVLTPLQAVDHLEEMLYRMPWITVAGIAGPGDAFADAERTLTTLTEIRRRHRRLHLCLSSNGLVLSDYIAELVRLRVDFVTITVNAIDPQVGAKIYRWIDWQGRRLQGTDAASLLLDRQLTAISRLASSGITVKVNSVVIPGINVEQTKAIAAAVSALGARLHNLIPIIPVAGTIFADIAPPSPEELFTLRKQAEAYLPQMRHCMRCRADSAGLIGGSCRKGAKRHTSADEKQRAY